jgi:disulfide bond formation protein DsbB
MTDLSRARLIAILVPNALLWGAIGSQYLGHLVPCEMCMWQRWPHIVAILFALAAIVTRRSPASRLFTMLAALAILVSGGLGVYHAGVEYHWWLGPPRCTGQHFTSLEDLMKAPPVMCDVPQWKLWNISLAGWNAIISILAGLAVFVLASRKARRR